MTSADSDGLSPVTLIDLLCGVLLFFFSIRKKVINRVFKLISGTHICQPWHFVIKLKSTLISPICLLYCVGIIFQCTAETMLSVERQMIQELGCSGNNYGSGLSCSVIKFICIKIKIREYFRIDTFKGNKNFISEFCAGLCKSVFFVITISYISAKCNGQYATSDDIKIINNKLNHCFLGLCLFIAILIILFTQQITDRKIILP